MSPAQAKAKARRELDAVGRRRKKLEREIEKLSEDTRSALETAKVARVPMNEAARRVKLNRTTLYQVYLNEEKDTSEVPAVAG